jgi:hypothetical protein
MKKSRFNFIERIVFARLYNQKAMDDCVSNLPAGSFFAEETCAYQLGLKIDVVNELLPKVKWW